MDQLSVAILSYAAKVDSTGLFPFFNEPLLEKDSSLGELLRGFLGASFADSRIRLKTELFPNRWKRSV